MCCRYHWSVEYFEDLRNVNHCEFIVMKQSETNKKYILQNELRTWSELKRRAAAAGGGNSTSTTPSRTHSQSALTESPTIPIRRWGGCVNGCNHDKANWPKRPMRKNTVEYLGQQAPATTTSPPIEEQDGYPVVPQDSTSAPVIEEPTPSKLGRKHSAKVAQATALPPTPASPNDASNDASTSDEDDARSRNPTVPRTSAILRHLQPPQRTPGEGFSDDSDYFPGMQHLSAGTNGKNRLRASSKQRQQSKERKLARKQTEKGWKEESGMGTGKRADALGDGDEVGTSGIDDVAAQTERMELGVEERQSLIEEDKGEPILREALKGNMQVEQKKGESATQGEEKIGEREIEKLEEKEGTAREQVY
jgi:hypothetical protein